MRQAVRLTLRALVVFAVLALAGAAASAIDGVVEDVWGSCSLSFTSLSQTRVTASATSHTGGITADVLEVEIDLAENNVFQLNAEVSMEDVWFVQVVRGDGVDSLLVPTHYDLYAYHLARDTWYDGMPRQYTDASYASLYRTYGGAACSPQASSREIWGGWDAAYATVSASESASGAKLFHWRDLFRTGLGSVPVPSPEALAVSWRENITLATGDWVPMLAVGPGTHQVTVWQVLASGHITCTRLSWTGATWELAGTVLEALQ